jgi:hypothetical protein
MSDTLSTPDPAEQVAEVRQIITHRGNHSCEATMFAVWRVVFPGPPDRSPGRPDPRPIATDEHGWPMLNAEGTAWERHDDPHADD